MKMELENMLNKIKVSSGFRKWVKRAGCNTLSEAWAACPRGDWMLWIAGELSGPPEGAARKKLAHVAAQCARLGLPFYVPHYVGDTRELEGIYVLEAYARGDIDIVTVRMAPGCDFLIVEDDAHLAALAAAANALAAGEAARAASGDPADRRRLLAQCADMVRKHYPNPPGETKGEK